MTTTDCLTNDYTMAMMTIDRAPALVTYDRSLYADYDIHTPSDRGFAKGTSVYDRFVDRLEVQPNGCIHFTGAVTTDGYGQIHIGTGPNGRLKKILTHRLAWMLTHGTIPNFVEVNHRCCSDSTCPGGQNCHHRRCCNTNHLELTTHQFNMDASAAKRRTTSLNLPCGHPAGRVNLIVRRGGVQICRQCVAEAKAA